MAAEKNEFKLKKSNESEIVDKDAVLRRESGQNIESISSGTNNKMSMRKFNKPKAIKNVKGKVNTDDL